MPSQLRKLRGGRTQFERASNEAVGFPKGTISDYDALRQQLKTDKILQEEVRKRFNLAGGYPAGRMQIHHKVFLKNLEPYFFHYNKKGKLVLRPQKDINALVQGIQKSGWDIGNLEKNLSVLPKYIHQGSSEVPGHLSVHSILRRYTDIQGVTDLSEFDNIREVIEDGQINKYGNKKFKGPDGKVTLDPELSLITSSQIGMSEDAADRIFRNNNIEDLVLRAKGKLDIEGPIMKSAIAASVFLADDVPLETKQAFIKELGGPKGADLDELFDNIRKAEGFTKRRLELDLEALKNKPLPKDLKPEQLAKRELQLENAKKAVRMQDELLRKLSDRPAMRKAGFSSPFSRNLRSRKILARRLLGASLLGLAGASFTHEGHAQTMEDWEADPSVSNAIQTWLSRGELLGDYVGTAGAGLSATGIGATVGVPVAIVGEGLAQVSGWSNTALELLENKEEVGDVLSSADTYKYLGTKILNPLKTSRELGGFAGNMLWEHGKKRFEQGKELIDQQSREETAEIPEQSTTVLNQGEGAEDIEEELKVGVSNFN